MRFCHLNILAACDAGVGRKLAQQARALARLPDGMQADAVMVALNREVADAVPSEAPIRVVPFSMPIPSPLKGFAQTVQVWRRLRPMLADYDAVVARWITPSPTFVATARRTVLFTEHHGKELEEQSLRSSYKAVVRQALERVFGPLVLRSAAGIVAVTDELRRYELDRAGAARPSLVLPNGVSPEEIAWSEAPRFDGEQLDLVLMSSYFYPWHGLDRLLEGLRAWRGPGPRIVVHLVGRLTPDQRQRIQQMGLGATVHAHGVLVGRELDDVLARCDLGIGNLGMHRKRQREASNLKDREYAARGLPLVVSYADPDFPPELPWILRLPADDSPVDLAAVVAFADRVCRSQELRCRIRRFTEANLSWRSKMERLAKFVRDTVAGIAA